MSDHDRAIEARGVTKVFRVGVKEDVRDSLGATLFNFLKSPLKNYRKYRSLYRFDDVVLQGMEDVAPDDVIWALNDVSFDVERGEVLGIVGRNGAGKSTLLKVLTRITPPSAGHIRIRGRVASLLEVGTGFHQELTGRENVYLNGTILGMRKREVDRKFDEIVEFSGVEKFLDTPVKRYSSGMRVRLAFAVAAHLEPEILIIDEVLAVGDAAFQRKCIDKMRDVGREGRTVLFVSHNMPAVSMLCSRAVRMESGRLVQSGSPQEIVRSYLNEGTGTHAAREWPADKAPGRDVARLRAVRVVDRSGDVVEAVEAGREIGIEMEYEVTRGGYVLLPHYNLVNGEGVVLFTTLDRDPAWCEARRPEGVYTSTAWISPNLLTEGVVYVNCHLITRSPNRMQFSERQAVAFNVLDQMGAGTARGDWAGPLSGVVRPRLDWTTELRGAEEARTMVG